MVFFLQTGPKGVITDWRRFKQLETEKRLENERERLQLAKKLTLTCRSHVCIFSLCFLVSVCSDYFTISGLALTQ